MENTTVGLALADTTDVTQKTASLPAHPMCGATSDEKAGAFKADHRGTCFGVPSNSKRSKA
jgi:hypothetical protein